jgi:uncharacterized membrane-anchored protein
MKPPFPLFARIALAVITGLNATFDATAQALEPEPASQAIPWIHGPTKVALGNVADIELPSGYLFLEEGPTRAVLRQLGTATTGQEIGFISPESHDWFAVVLFVDSGFVKPEPAGTAEVAATFAQLRALEDIANKQRAQQQQPPVEVTGWEIPPSIDLSKGLVEWAIRTETGGHAVVNHYVSLLGRSGALKFCLVDQRHLASVAGEFRQLAERSRFRAGEGFGDHAAGDRIAAGGIQGLITGREKPLPLQVQKGPAATAASGAASATEGFHGVRIELTPDARRLLTRLFVLLLVVISALAAGYIFGMIAGVRHRARSGRSRSGAAPRSPAKGRLAWLRPKIGRPHPAASPRPQEVASAVAPTPRRHPAPALATATAPANGEDQSPEDSHRHWDAFAYYSRLTRDLYRHKG